MSWDALDALLVSNDRFGVTELLRLCFMGPPDPLDAADDPMSGSATVPPSGEDTLLIEDATVDCVGVEVDTAGMVSDS